VTVAGTEYRWWSEPCAGGCQRTIMVRARQPGTVVVHPDCPLPESPENVGVSVHYVRDSDHCHAGDGQS
jgi:hypothetical protein